jgi:hypothetical protein
MSDLVNIRSTTMGIEIDKKQSNRTDSWPAEVKSVNDLPPEINSGNLDTYKSNIHVQIREVGPNENYEYYGRVAVSGIDYVLQRKQSDGSYKDASPIKKDEFGKTYQVTLEGDFEKVELTRVCPVPEGVSVQIFTREGQGNSETVTGPNEAIAFDTTGAPYKFPLTKNTSGENPAFSRVGSEQRASNS